MEVDTDEVEIKIEYFESQETDPLSKITQEKRLYTAECSEEIQSEHDKIESANECLKLNNKYDNLNSMVEQKNIEAAWHKGLDPCSRYLCKFCELKYSTMQTLRHHVRMKHPIEHVNLKSSMLNNKRNRKIYCHICKTRFKTISMLQLHAVQHSKESLLNSCWFCDATFDTKNQMYDHIKLHHKNTSHKMHSCSLCGYRTAKMSHFKQHVNTHVKDNMKKCTYCNYSTNYLPNLRTHERLHKGEKPYICGIKDCKYTCAAKSALRSHQLKHYPEKNNLYCDKCNYRTVYKQSLKKHIDSHIRDSIKKVQ